MLDAEELFDTLPAGLFNVLLATLLASVETCGLVRVSLADGASRGDSDSCSISYLIPLSVTALSLIARILFDI